MNKPEQFHQIALDNGKEFSVNISRRAQAELEKRSEPLVVELELYFSCLIKKFVHFHDGLPVQQGVTLNINDKLIVWFHPVHSEACLPEQAAVRQPHQDVDIKNIPKVFPKTLQLDFNKNWQAEYSL